MPLRYVIRLFTVGNRGIRIMATSRPSSKTLNSHVDALLEKVPDRIKNTLSRTIGLAGVVIISLSAMLYVF